MVLLIKYTFMYFCLQKQIMNCSRCNCSIRVKFGKLNRRQRYKCKECGFNYTVEIKSTAKPIFLKKQALHLYLEVLGFRSIGRLLGVSNVSVLIG